ncbi:BnaA07g03280D [Brassica napus]|uniref:BnaA07g03280D protein n=1 Tax=Brassica napus TaxID=3708 RepID=A0A078H3H9_BRANA|nr:BnaA07g03280D [Brassica napus]
MAVWRIITRSYLKYASTQLTRNYTQSCLATSLTHVVKQTKLSSFDIPHSDISRKPSKLFDNVRLFATSAQTRKKEEEVESDGPRLNDKITAETVRLVSEEGHCIVSLKEALRRAKELKHDLIEVQRDANPPVCKIADYAHEKYKKAQVGKERAKAKRAEVTIRPEVKEIRFTPKIDAKDLKFKAKQALKLMESGYRVKCHAVPDKDKKKELEPEKLLELLSRFTCYIKDALVEFGPEADKCNAVVVVRHAKFGPPKKGKAIKLKEMNIKTAAKIKDDSPKLDSSEADDDQGVVIEETPEPVKIQNRYAKSEPSNDFSGGRDAKRVEPQAPERPRFQNQQPNGRFDPQSPNQPPGPPRPRFPNQQPAGRFDPQSPSPTQPRQPPSPQRPRFPDRGPNQQPSGPSPDSHLDRQGPPPRFQNQYPNQQATGRFGVQPPKPPPRSPPPPRPPTRLPNETSNQQPTGPGRATGEAPSYGIFSTPNTK